MGAVRWLVGDSRPQDSLVFAFSGHGCLDVSREQERDGILSSDYEQVQQLSPIIMDHASFSWEPDPPPISEPSGQPLCSVC